MPAPPAAAIVENLRLLDEGYESGSVPLLVPNDPGFRGPAVPESIVGTAGLQR